MATKNKAPKAPVVIKAPKIVSAWKNVSKVTGKSDADNSQAVLALGKEMLASTLSIRDIKKVITDSAITSPIISVGQVEGLRAFVTLHAKFAEFRALPLAKQLSKANATYKLGTTKAEKVSSFANLESEIKGFNSEKSAKAKANKAPKATPKAKEVTDTKAVLTSFLAFVNALNAESITTKEAEIMEQISMKLVEFETLDA